MPLPVPPNLIRDTNPIHYAGEKYDDYRARVRSAGLVMAASEAEWANAPQVKPSAADPAPNRPFITAITPNSGPAAGGTAVTIDGVNLAGTMCRFGSKDATNATFTATRITCKTPPGVQGTGVDVIVGATEQYGGSWVNGYVYT